MVELPAEMRSQQASIAAPFAFDMRFLFEEGLLKRTMVSLLRCKGCDEVRACIKKYGFSEVIRKNT
uniref:Uncharacterized protein n=1 Tax=Roseihalotalea indica TaxID=2867963 RepID=A0AA49GHQ1_9BACT|nr:hypothetical protein K4G66_16760 [Tunicatimonas sp. TK19036]